MVKNSSEDVVEGQNPNSYLVLATIEDKLCGNPSVTQNNACDHPE